MFEKWNQRLVVACAAWAGIPADQAKEPLPPKLDAKNLVQELQRVSSRRDVVDLVYWLPNEWWEAQLDVSGASTKDAQPVLRIVRAYTVLVVVDAMRGPAPGDVTYRKESEIRENLSIKTISGEVLRPIQESDIDPAMRQVIAGVGPNVARAFDRLGQNMHWYVFRQPGAKDSIAPVDAKSRGRFVVRLGDREYIWHLPLESAVEPKECPTCKERLNGAYNFCPWDGTSLAVAK